jgi:hypothetical protein
VSDVDVEDESDVAEDDSVVAELPANLNCDSVPELDSEEDDEAAAATATRRTTSAIILGR